MYKLQKQRKAKNPRPDAPGHTAPDMTTTAPAAIPTWQDRAAPLAALGWKARDAEWLTLVALHSGIFLRSQWCRYFNDANREAARVLVHQLIDKQLAIEDERMRFPGGARAVLLTGKPIYRALDIEDVRHRRGKQASLTLLMRRLLSLDYLIERPSFGWLPTEDDKVRRFEALGIDRRALPVRNYGEELRYFDVKLPVAVDAQTATFVYVNPGQSTHSELRDRRPRRRRPRALDEKRCRPSRAADHAAGNPRRNRPAGGRHQDGHRILTGSQRAWESQGQPRRAARAPHGHARHHAD